MNYIRIANENERAEVAKILYKNGYSISPVRKKKNGKSYEYYVGYEMKSRDLDEDEEK